jgi:hypothetical protein
VSSGELETALRECLARQAARSGAAVDRADAVVHRVRRVRRRRAGAGALSLLLVTSATVVGVVRLADMGTERPYGPAFVGQGPDQPVASETTPSPAGQYATDPVALSGSVAQEPMAKSGSPPVDLVVAGTLRTSTGESISLSAVGAIAEAYRVAEGWLVLGAQAGHASLWYVAGGGQPRQLLSGVDRLAIASDGRHVAWRAASSLYVGSVAEGEVRRAGETPATGDAVPVGFVGTGVLVTTRAGGRYDVWWPDRGRYVPNWRDLPSGVYGALPDGRTVVAQVPGGSAAQPCLALLDATAALAVRKRACDVPLNPGAVGWLSPDGRWLVAEGAVDAAVLVDLADAFGDRRPAVDAGPGPYGPAVWVDARTLVHAGPGRQLVRLHLDRLAAGQGGGVERIPVADVEVASEPIIVVPQLA